MATKILEVDVTAVLENPPLFSPSNIIMFFRSLFFAFFLQPNDGPKYCLEKQSFSILYCKKMVFHISPQNNAWMSCAQAEIWPMPSDALRCPPMPPRCPPKMVPDALLMPSLEALRPSPNQLSKAKHVYLTVLIEPLDTPYSSYHIYFWMYHFRFCVESFSHGPPM